MIPEFVFVLADILATCLEMFFLLFLMRNESRISGIWRMPTFYLVLICVIVGMTKINTPILIKFAVGILLISLLGKMVYVCSFMKLLLYGLVYIITMYASEMLVIQIWNLFNEPVFSNNVIYREFVLSLIIVVKAVQFFMVNLLEKVMRSDKNSRNLKEILPVICSGIPFILVLESINLNLPYVSDERYIAIFIGSSAAVLGAFAFSVIFNNHYLEVRNKAQLEKATLYELQVKYDYYQKRMVDEERVKEIYHDLKNHFLIASNNFDVETKEKLLRYENYYDTGNEFLNIIIADKSERARLNKIHFECDVRYTDTFVEALDISTIFGNILDNGIEACEKLAEEERFIFLNVAKRGNLLLIVMKNKISGCEVDIGQLKTNKKNKEFHGFGLSNVKKAIKKYNGECKISIEKKEFIISIVLPIPD